MLVFPSKLHKNRVLKNRTIVFETEKKNEGNIVFIATHDEKTSLSLMNSGLFKKNLIKGIYVPRVVKPMGMKTERINFGEYYKKIKEQTSGSVGVGRPEVTRYLNKNFFYDMSKEISLNIQYIRKVGQMRTEYLLGLMGQIIEDTMDKAQYDESFLVFPITETYESIKREALNNPEPDDPLVILLRCLLRGFGDFSKFATSKIMIYSDKLDALVTFDLDEESFKTKKMFIVQLIERLHNGHKLGVLEDDEEEYEEELSPEETYENKKEDFKNAVVSKYTQKLKIESTDEKLLDKNEREIVSKLKNKVDSYLDTASSTEEIFEKIEKDTEIKTSTLEYISRKKIADKLDRQYQKHLEQETEVATSLEDMIDSETEGFLDVEKFDIDDVDERVKTSTLASMDSEYIKKLFKKDLNSSISSFSQQTKFPIALTSFSLENSSDDFNKKETLKLVYKSDLGETLRFNIDIPKFINDRYFYLNGGKKIMLKQLVRLPIVKTKNNRVEIATNFYSKITIERTTGKVYRENAYLIKLLNQVRDLNEIEIVDADTSKINLEFNNTYNTKSNLQFDELSSYYESISNKNICVLFNREDFLKIVNEKFDDRIDDVITKDMTPLAYEYDNDVIYVIDDSKNANIFKISFENNKYRVSIVKERIYDFIVEDILNIKDFKLPVIGKSFSYTVMKILKKNVPLLLGLLIPLGLKTTLDLAKAKHHISEKRDFKFGYMEFKFEDKYLYIEDTIFNSLLFSALYHMSCENYKLSEFETTDPYEDYVVNMMGQPKDFMFKIENNLDLIIDPITLSVLADLKLPTEIHRLLLLANSYLTNNAHKKMNDISNYRIRGNEVVPALLYKILSSGYVRYKNGRNNNKSNPTLMDKIKPSTLISELMSSQNVSSMSVLNPTLEAENIATVSPKGKVTGINLNEAYTSELRAYDPKSMVGIFGNGTPYSGQAGINRYMTLNPKLTHVRGYVGDVDVNNLDATNMFSPTELLSSYTSTHSDPPRQAMYVSQSKHTLPIEDTDAPLIHTGVNKILPFILSDDFAFKAKKDGVVKKIDQENKLVIIEYDDGTLDAIDIKETIAENSAGGFYLKNKIVFNYEEGERFKRNDILSQNPSFFTGKGKNVTYKPGKLAKVALSPGDFAFEDSCLISESLSQKCSSNVIMKKAVALNKHSIITNIAEIEQPIQTNDILIEFIESPEDPSANEFLLNLSKDYGDLVELSGERILSKYSGKIADIKIYYNVDESELSESLRDILNKYRTNILKRKNALSGVTTDSVIIPVIEKINTKKIGNVEFDGMFIEFYVEYNDLLTEGDKIVFSTALKGIVSRRVTLEESPFSEKEPGEPIDAVMTPTGLISRMVPDFLFQLYTNKVLIYLKRKIKEMYGKKN